MVHVRFDGRSFDLDERIIGLVEHAAQSDIQVKEVIARHLDISPDALRYSMIDRQPNGDIILRPEAVYG